MLRLATSATGSPQVADFAIRQLLPQLSSLSPNRIKEASQIILDGFEEFKKEEEMKNKMIQAIELVNFLSHHETRLELDSGVTVFVGDNGAGKSSVIDAITFALFGDHTRKGNKELIKRGATQGLVNVNMTINDTQYKAERKIDHKGGLSAQLSKKMTGEWMQIAAGERKQFGESMTGQVEKIVGLTFEKLKIASIVRQGELNSIINAKPKEFKELLNTIIGIDTLDIASEAMKIAKKDFRESIQQRIGYDDTHINILQKN